MLPDSAMSVRKLDAVLNMTYRVGRGRRQQMFVVMIGPTGRPHGPALPPSTTQRLRAGAKKADHTQFRTPGAHRNELLGRLAQRA